jgi:hypothetical protein
VETNVPDSIIEMMICLIFTLDSYLNCRRVMSMLMSQISLGQLPHIQYPPIHDPYWGLSRPYLFKPPDPTFDQGGELQQSGCNGLLETGMSVLFLATYSYNSATLWPPATTPLFSHPCCWGLQP